MQSTNLLNIKELQIKKLLESNNFIAFVSYSNFDTNQSYEFKNSLNNLGFKAKFIQNKRLKSLLANTGYKSISSVFQGKVFLIYSENSGLETQKVLLKLIDTSPQLFLLGWLENGLYFYSPSMVTKLFGLLSLFENQAGVYQNLTNSSKGVLGLLNNGGQQLYRFLTHNQVNVLNLLIAKSK